MEQLLSVLGWIVYGGVVLYAFSGLLFIFRAARMGGNVTQMGLFQWAFAVACAVAFALAAWNKLHLLWNSANRVCGLVHAARKRYRVPGRSHHCPGIWHGGPTMKLADCAFHPTAGCAGRG